MIRIRRSHYADRAFSAPKTFSRAGGRIKLRLTPDKRTPLGDSYRLEVWPAALRGEAKARAMATCELIEERTGKWFLAGGAQCGARMPSAVQRHVDLFVAELDAAVHAETAPKTTPARIAGDTQARRAAFAKTRNYAHPSIVRPAETYIWAEYLKWLDAQPKKKRARKKPAKKRRGLSRAERAPIAPAAAAKATPRRPVLIEGPRGQLEMFGQTEMFPS